MRCSICGKDGHNSRTCTYRDSEPPRDQALWMKFDNITEREAADLQAAIIKETLNKSPGRGKKWYTGRKGGEEHGTDESGRLRIQQSEKEDKAG